MAYALIVRLGVSTETLRRPAGGRHPRDCCTRSTVSCCFGAWTCATAANRHGDAVKDAALVSGSRLSALRAWPRPHRVEGGRRARHCVTLAHYAWATCTCAIAVARTSRYSGPGLRQRSPAPLATVCLPTGGRAGSPVYLLCAFASTHIGGMRGPCRCSGSHPCLSHLF